MTLVRKHAVIYLNGKRREIGPEHARMMLGDFLRYEAGLTGTKIVCAEGDCGACTVLRAFCGLPGPSAFLPINSCIVTVAQMDGSSLLTVDALAKDNVLTPMQSAMVKCHGSQCGFCTPGFVMVMTGLVEEKLRKNDGSGINEREAKNCMTGNLCRCTGYQPIIEATTSVKPSECESLSKRFDLKAHAKDLRQATAKPLLLENEGYRFFAPRTLKDATKELSRNKEARLLGGATDLGVTHNKWRSRLTTLVSLHLIPELYALKKINGGRISVGARVTLAELREFTKELAPEFARFLDLFASPQIKNVATLVGNVANASPIADTPPFLLVTEALVEVVGPRGSRSIPLENFFISYRKTALKRGELIAALSFVPPTEHETLALRKVSERKDLDISSVNAAFHIAWSDRKTKNIKAARLALGGVASTTLRLPKTESVLRGQSVSPELIEKAAAALQREITPLSDVRGSASFRRVLAENLLRRFFSETAP